MRTVPWFRPASISVFSVVWFLPMFASGGGMPQCLAQVDHLNLAK